MWCIEFDPKTRALTLKVALQPSIGSLRAFQRKHLEGLAATAGESFRVLLDLRGVSPLGADAAGVLSEVKRAEAALPGFQMRVVLCDSATVAMQQRRTSQTEATNDREHVTLDDDEAYSLLRAP
jgi:hypothetical protein